MQDATDPFDLIEPDDTVYADYAARFAAYNQAASGGTVQTYSIVLRQDDTIVAGGRGHVFLGALEVRGLWIDAHLRRHGLGRRLLRRIEDEARSRHATKAMLYTYSWQAEQFYILQGYTTYARFDFPDGPYRVDMQKEL